MVPAFQAEIVPSSVAKMKCAEVPGPLTKKSDVLPLKTIPVGLEVVPAGLPAGGGIVTTSPCLAPSPLYRVERPVWLSLTHQGLVGLAASPQGLTKSLSVPSETRLVCTKRVCFRAMAWM